MKNKVLTESLYDRVLHYNIYKKKWYAVKREHVNDYFNGVFHKETISAKSINSLILKVKLNE